MRKIACVLTLVCAGTDVQAGDYFSNMEEHLTHLSEGALFFRDKVCPTKTNAQSCRKLTEQYYTNGENLQNRLDRTRKTVRNLETHPETASVALKEMQDLHEDVLRHVRNGRLVLYTLAE